MLNTIYICCLTLIFTYISSGIINLRQVKKKSTFIQRGLAAFPKNKRAIVYCCAMLLYLIVLSIIITNFYSGNLCDYIKTIAIASLMWPMAQIDYKYKRIPNKLIILGLIYRAVILVFEIIFYRDGLLYTVVFELIAAIGIGLVLLLSLLIIKNGIGMGDIKFFMLMGLFLGAYRLISAVFIVMIIAFFIALYKLIIKKEGKKAEFAFGPSIAIGSLISFIIFGN